LPRLSGRRRERCSTIGRRRAASDMGGDQVVAALRHARATRASPLGLIAIAPRDAQPTALRPVTRCR
jgi:hypothetical protein